MSFPRTKIENVSVPRMLIGINWFMGYCHQTQAKSKFNTHYMTRQRIADIIATFVEEAGIDCVYGVLADWTKLVDAIKDAEDRTGRKITRITTPDLPTGADQESLDQAACMLDRQAAMGAAICLPHQGCTDALIDRRNRRIDMMDTYCAMIRERGMVPGLSTHTPEAVVYADETELDVATYVQIYNAAGFLMQVEADWVHRMIHNAKKPVIAIKTLAAGRLQPLVGMSFAWSTLRDQDMVCVGTMTPDEAKELIEISYCIFERRGPNMDLQRTRSKSSMEGMESMEPHS